MLFNRRRAEDLIATRGFDVLVASSPENVLYLTGFECTTHWINKGFQQYALFSPGRSPDASLIAPALELDALADGDIWVEDIYLFSPFSRGQPTGVTPVDEVGQRGRAIVKTSPSVDTAMDGLVAAIEARGLGSSRIGLDESGMSIRALEELRRRLPNASFSYAADLLWEIRMVKTEPELRRLERATEISENAIRAAYALIRPGVREADLIDSYHREIAMHNARPTFCIIASGSRSSYPHALRSERAIEEGDIVRYDIGCTYKYYHADNARAIVVGEPSVSQKRIWEALVQGVEDATAAVKPGARPDHLFKIAMAPAQALGLDNFDRFHCGHGIGISVYDPPVITAANAARSAFLMPDIKNGLEENMAINIEVGYYIQGVMGFLYEDTIVVTADGRRLLTQNSKSLDLQTFVGS